MAKKKLEKKLPQYEWIRKRKVSEMEVIATLARAFEDAHIVVQVSMRENISTQVVSYDLDIRFRNW